MARAIHIVLSNEDKGYTFGEWTERLEDTYMGEDATMGEIYRASVKEYGRCTSKVYVDTDDGTKQVGWFFVKRAQYEDTTGKTYLQGAWVSVGEYRPARSEGIDF